MRRGLATGHGAGTADREHENDRADTAAAVGGRQTVRAFINRIFGRLRNREDSEHEQAIWRVMIPSVVLCYMLGIWTVSPEPYASSHLFWAGCVVAFEGLLGAALVIAILLRP